jgi:hypothetical protein
MDNAGGYAGATINYGSPSPAELLQQGAALNERRNEREQTLAAQRSKQLGDNRLKNIEYDHNLGKAFKPLPGHLQDMFDEQLKTVQDKYTGEEYLGLDPATYQKMLVDETKNLGTIHDKIFNNAQDFEKNFERYAQDNPTIPKAQAYQMGVDKFINNHMTYGQDGKLTFMPPQHVNDEDIVNGYLSDPNTIGRMNVPLEDLFKNGNIPTNEVGETHSVNDRGNLKAYSVRGKTNDFMQPVKDPKTGLTTAYELKSKPVPGVTDPRTGQEARVPTDEYMQQLLSTRNGQNSYARHLQLTKDYFKGNIDDEHADILTKAAIYNEANKRYSTPTVITEKEATPKPPHITINNNDKNPGNDWVNRMAQASQGNWSNKDGAAQAIDISRELLSHYNTNGDKLQNVLVPYDNSNKIVFRYKGKPQDGESEGEVQDLVLDKSDPNYPYQLAQAYQRFTGSDAKLENNIFQRAPQTYHNLQTSHDPQSTATHPAETKKETVAEKMRRAAAQK